MNEKANQRKDTTIRPIMRPFPICVYFKRKRFFSALSVLLSKALFELAREQNKTSQLSDHCFDAIVAPFFLSSSRFMTASVDLKEQLINIIEDEFSGLRLVITQKQFDAILQRSYLLALFQDGCHYIKWGGVIGCILGLMIAIPLLIFSDSVTLGGVLILLGFIIAAGGVVASFICIHYLLEFILGAIYFFILFLHHRSYNGMHIDARKDASSENNIGLGVTLLMVLIVYSIYFHIF